MRQAFQIPFDIRNTGLDRSSNQPIQCYRQMSRCWAPVTGKEERVESKGQTGLGEGPHAEDLRKVTSVFLCR